MNKKVEKEVKMGVAETKKADEYVIKPENTAAKVDTSEWPLLLKNYEKLQIRTGHFTPIPFGSSPYQRDLKSYVSSGVINLVSPPATTASTIVSLQLETQLLGQEKSKGDGVQKYTKNGR